VPRDSLHESGSSANRDDRRLVSILTAARRQLEAAEVGLLDRDLAAVVDAVLLGARAVDDALAELAGLDPLTIDAEAET
jgi:hypothetical protein